MIGKRRCGREGVGIGRGGRVADERACHGGMAGKM